MARYQPFNDLPAKQFQALKDDIEARGIVSPILVDEHDKTIDGHQRRRVAAELGIDCPRVVIDGLSETDKGALAIAVNLFRRHLTPADRMDAVQKMANLGMSQRRIADATGVSRRTVERDLKAGGAYAPPANVDPETGEIKDTKQGVAADGAASDGDAATRSDGADGHDVGRTAPEAAPAPRVTGRDGKSYPATKPKVADLADDVSKSDLGYRATTSREITKVRSGLLTLDPERVVAVTASDDRAALKAFAVDITAWAWQVTALLDEPALRSVK